MEPYAVFKVEKFGEWNFQEFKPCRQAGKKNLTSTRAEVRRNRIMVQEVG